MFPGYENNVVADIRHALYLQQALTNHNSLINLLLFKISTTCWRDFLEGEKKRSKQNLRSFLDAILIITNPFKKKIAGQTPTTCLKKKNIRRALMLFLNISVTTL